MKKYDALELAQYALQLSSTKKIDSSIKIYERTNEDLKQLFSIYDVCDKDVLTVLSSSDQLFSCYYNHAHSIDTFDKSYLTLYYYYLRKWLIIYRNKMYPSYHFFYDGDDDLYELVCSVTPNNHDEADAKIFWMNYLKNHYKMADKYLFHISSYTQPKPFDNHLNSIKSLFDTSLHFTCLDMFQKNIQFHKKYDVLVLSNMLEYSKDKDELLNARDNIESLLNEDGIAICTFMIHHRNSKTFLNETDILTSHYLELEKQEHTYYEPLLGKERDLAYSYRLKRK